MAEIALNWNALNYLVNAPSKKSALKCFNRAFVNRNSPNLMPIATLCEELSINEIQAIELTHVLIHIIKAALYDSEVEPTLLMIDSETKDLDVRLRGLIGQIITAQLPVWREASILQRPSLPRYLGLDWRVDVKTASDRMSRMSAPSLILDLKVQDQPQSAGQIPAARRVEFELSKEALQTMLDGLGRIRNQLGSVAAPK